MATELKLPEVGEGVEAGTVVSVLVSEGDQVELDQPVLELETDKAVVEVPSTVAGTVQSVSVKANEEVRVGQTILTVTEGGDAPAEPAEEPADEKPAGEAQEVETPAPAAHREDAPPREGAETGVLQAAGARPTPEPTAQSGEDNGELLPAAPSVRRLARELGVDLREVPGSGILGRISANDVQRFADGGAASAPAAAAAGPAVQAPPLPDFSRWGEVEREPMSGIRKATVRSMSTAWSTVPMVTHFDKANATDFEALRKRYGDRAEAIGAKLTPTAMIIKVVAGALRRFPDFNASIDVGAQEIVYKKYVNIGVAVDTDAGLLVPVIKNADRKSMLELAAELGELAEKARDRKLSPDEMSGGNFSVSNLGGIGGHGFTPIVNPPDVAILGVARSSYEPIYNRETGEFEPQLMMPLTLSYDHRLIDGAAAARFLRWICAAIEDPFLLSLEG